jgi:Bifunctional DNA primase/polymerase, N-terminal
MPTRQRDLELLCAAMAQRRWKIVLLLSRSKRPTGPQWQITDEPDLVRRHVGCLGNVGLLTGDRETASGVVVFDIDRVDLLRHMEAELGPLGRPWTMTGSGKFHYFFTWQPDLPAKITRRGEVVGEVQRGGSRDAPPCNRWSFRPASTPSRASRINGSTDPTS